MTFRRCKVPPSPGEGKRPAVPGPNLTPSLSLAGRGGAGHALAVALLLALTLLLTACAPSLSACAPGDLRVGLITGVTGIDGAENALIWQGIARADRQLTVCAQFIESRTPEDYQKEITALAEERFDLIIAGPALSTAVQEMAPLYPQTHFLLVDGSLDPSQDNVYALAFRVDQAAFPAGYLAAAWSDVEDPEDPWVGYVASRQNPLAELYVVAFKTGVLYYNTQQDRTVGFRGVYLDAEEIQDADEQANALIDLGIDVIFEVSDGSLTGALAMAKGRGKWGIGADLDPYDTLSEARDILLTSPVKRLDNATYLFLELWTQGGAAVPNPLVGTLENGGVGLAPYHDTEKQIPASIKKQVADIQQAIVEGSLSSLP